MTTNCLLTSEAELSILPPAPTISESPSGHVSSADEDMSGHVSEVEESEATCCVSDGNGDATAISDHQQRHANENLFLRYLELDPMEGPEAIPAAMQRNATGNKFGRTPFTRTKHLTKPSNAGFGFSVVWTHPPRVERVEKGLSADKAGILPGDYIIFVEMDNVVTMPEVDVLKIIRSHGNQISLEIFRRNTTTNSTKITSESKPVDSSDSVEVKQEIEPITTCSRSSNLPVENYARKKLQLPQIKFTTEQPESLTEEDSKKQPLYQLINKEQNYATWLQFGISRFVTPLLERHDLISQGEHKMLFQNCDELLNITADILNTLTQDVECQVNNIVKTYHSKSNQLLSAYKRYCSGLKKADCVLANKLRNINGDFVKFLQTPVVPRRRPDLTALIHKPLEHYRDILKLLTVIEKMYKGQQDEQLIRQVIQRFQKTYREMTSEAGLMEPAGEGRPLLTIQDLESRLVFTRSKPFEIAKPGRQWIFGGDLGRIEGKNVRQYWTLLFSDLLLFTKASRDRVLFVMDEPIMLANITDVLFHIKKKDTEFRICINPDGANALSPTVKCGPDLGKTPKKHSNKYTVILRAPTVELKAVWQNLIQRQILHIGVNMDSSAFSSPLETPDNPITSSMATLQSTESLYILQRFQEENYNINHHKKPSQSQVNNNAYSTSKNGVTTITNRSNNNHQENCRMNKPQTVSSRMIYLNERDTKNDGTRSTKNEHNATVTATTTTLTTSPPHQNTQVSVVDDGKSSRKHQATSSPSSSSVSDVCQQCHRGCFSSSSGSHTGLMNSSSIHRKATLTDDTRNDCEFDKHWGSLLLVGLKAANPAASLVQIDPFTPMHQQQPSESKKTITRIDDDSPVSDTNPYHSLSSSNATLKKYETTSSLEHVGSNDDDDDQIEKWELDNNSSCESTMSNDGVEVEKVSSNDCEIPALSNNPFMFTTWASKATSMVAEKLTFFDTNKYGEECQRNGKTVNRLISRSLTKSLQYIDIQEDEISETTSGEEIWGTPTSGGDIEELNSPSSLDESQSLCNGVGVNVDNNKESEIVIDKFLMTSHITGSYIRSLFPRFKLEPLIEEECSEFSSSESVTTVTSSDQSSENGNAADVCLRAAVADTKNVTAKVNVVENTLKPGATLKLCRSESYQRVVQAIENTLESTNPQSFFKRFKRSTKYSSIQGSVSKNGNSNSNSKLMNFFTIKREHRIHQSPINANILKIFMTKNAILDEDIPSTKPFTQNLINDKQRDKRFWKQLIKRRRQ